MVRKESVTAIITRTKNRNTFLERAIKTVLSQTSKSYVHIVLNDGGDEKSLHALLDKYPDKNRTVINNSVSVGRTRALNQAIKSTNTDYIAILDDDDTWHSDRIASTTAYLDEHKDKLAVLVTMEIVVERVSNNGTVEEVAKKPWYEDVKEVSLYDQLIDNYISNGCVTYRRSFFDEVGGYDESLDAAEDWDFGIKLIMKQDVSFLPKVLTWYHHRPDARGDNGNSVFSEADVHKSSLVKLRNRYMRDEIKRGKFGIGYIINQLSYERQFLRSEMEQRTVRIEGHINQQTGLINDEVSKVLDGVDDIVVRNRADMLIKGKLSSLKNTRFL